MEREQLISAYVWREMSAGERQAADELLRVDPQFKQQVQKFAEWSDWLKQGRLEVSAEMVQSLRKRIEERVTVETASALVAIRCSGEINASEKAQLDREINKNPTLRLTSERLEKFTQKLEAGKLEVSDKLQAKLRHNVQVAIAAKPRRVAKTQPKPTVRIYVSPEVSNPWTFRISAAAAVVALLATGGIYVATQNGGTPNIATTGPVKNTEPAIVNQDKPEVVHHVPAPQVIPDNQPQPEGTLEPREEIVEGRPKPPAAVPNNNDKVVPTAPEKRIVDNDPKLPLPASPVIPEVPAVPKNDRIAQGSPQVAPPIETPAPQIPTPGSNGRIAQGPKSNNGGGGGGTVPVGPNISADDGNKTSKPDSALAEKNNSPKTPKTPNPKDQQQAPEPLYAIAEIVMGSTAQFAPEGGLLTSIRGKMQIPSGSEITSGQTHFNLLLPGNSQLYVNVNSSLTLKFDRSGVATVLLKSGEVYYNGKNVKIELANQPGIALASGKAVDAKLTPVSVIFGVVQGSATVAANGGQKKVSAPNAVVVPFNGQDLQSVALGSAIAWAGDLGADLNGRRPASDEDDAKNKNRNRKRK